MDLVELQARAQAEGRRCVAGALIRDEAGRVFVQRRGPQRRFLPGCWDIPGGHVEPGETVLEALAREVVEETGWTVVGHPQLIFVADWETSEGERVDRRREFDFLVDVVGDLRSPRLEQPQHTDFLWVDRSSIARLDENRTAEPGLIRRLVTAALYWPRSSRPSYPHATVFLSGSAAVRVEEARLAWDPVMADGIAAHVTVGYPREVPDLAVMIDRTEAAAREVGPFEIEVDGIGCDQRHGNVFLRVADRDGGLGRLRALLLPDDVDAVEAWAPHVTLVHPRTTNRGVWAWEQLRGSQLGGRFLIRDVHVTALVGSRWQTAASFGLHGGVG